jgi:hypothetical protein
MTTPPDLPPLDAIGEFKRAGHEYLSTSCLHGSEPGRESLHTYCQSGTGSNGTTEWVKDPACCKFCGTPCICWCHASPSVPVPGTESHQDGPRAPEPVPVEAAGVSVAPGAAHPATEEST